MDEENNYINVEDYDESVDSDFVNGNLVPYL